MAEGLLALYYWFSNGRVGRAEGPGGRGGGGGARASASASGVCQMRLAAPVRPERRGRHLAASTTDSDGRGTRSSEEARHDAESSWRQPADRPAAVRAVPGERGGKNTDFDSQFLPQLERSSST